MKLTIFSQKTPECPVWDDTSFFIAALDYVRPQRSFMMKGFRFLLAMLALALVLGLALAGCSNGSVETIDVSTAAELKAAFDGITDSGDYLINIKAPLTITEAMTLNTGANVTIKGASASTEITSSANGVFWAEKGKITLENLKITGGAGLVAVGTGTMEIKNGVSVIGNFGAVNNGLFVGNTATLIMSGGTVEGFNAVLLASSWREYTGKVTISGGTIRNCGVGIQLLENASNSTFTISGGDISGSQAGIVINGSNNTVTISGGKVSSDGVGIYVAGGSGHTVRKTGGTVTGGTPPYSIEVGAQATVTGF
jgi:hypothetical protein